MGIGLAWSPDGTEIAYVAPYPPEGSGGILVHSLVTGKVRELTNPKPYAEGLVAWSPDGKQIAFTRSLTRTARELFVVSSRGGPARRLTFDNQITNGFAWTGDSRSLVLSSNRSGGAELWRVPVAGGTPERVPMLAHNPTFPTISARGNRLAFSDSFSDSNIWQYERPVPGESPSAPPFGSPKCLICSTAEDHSPSFSPDGRKIVFASRRTGSEEIWVADSDGSYPIQLTFIGSTSGSPRWSPDGHWIAFGSLVRGSPDIFVISAQGGAVRQLTNDPAADTGPAWSRDGRWIYFISDRGGSSHIWKVPFEGGLARQVTQGGGGWSTESADGQTLYYLTKSTVWRVPAAGGPEEPVPEIGPVLGRGWTVAGNGIYFFQRGSAAAPLIQFFNFAAPKVTTVLAPDRPSIYDVPALDVSPDGRKLLYVQVDSQLAGLMMIENFR
jgi:Tol biopolymer transport system component